MLFISASRICLASFLYLAIAHVHAGSTFKSTGKSPSLQVRDEKLLNAGVSDVSLLAALD
jgi:hypothetical protein